MPERHTWRVGWPRSAHPRIMAIPHDRPQDSDYRATDIYPPQAQKCPLLAGPAIFDSGEHPCLPHCEITTRSLTASMARFVLWLWPGINLPMLAYHAGGSTAWHEKRERRR